MDFLIDSITRKNTRISFFYLTVYFNRNRFNGLTLFVRCTVCNADMFAFLKLRQLANISCIRCFDACFDIDDTARHSCFARLTHRFTDGNDTVIAIRLQDVPLRHLTAVAESRRVRDSICNICVVAKCHVLAISSTCIHTDCNTVIAGTGAVTYGQRIVLGFRLRANCYRIVTTFLYSSIRANSYGINAICQSADTGCQRVLTLCTIVVVVASLFIRGIYTVEMRLSRFQLSHVDGIRILRASSDIGNLTGNVLRSIADRNGSCRRFPGRRCIIRCLFRNRIIADGIFINRSYRTGTDGYTAVHRGIGIMTEDDCVFFLCCDRRLFVGIADNHRIFHAFRLAIITKENRILGIGDGIIGTGGIQMGSAIDGIIETINHIII